MALQKTLENGAGNSGDYWRVDSINMERTGLKLEARLNLYRSKVDRDGGKRRMDEQKVLVLDIPPGSTTLNQIVGGVYTQAKITPTNEGEDPPFFADAVDV